MAALGPLSYVVGWRGDFRERPGKLTACTMRGHVRTLKRFFPLAIVAACAAGGWFWFRTPPDALFARALAAVEQRDIPLVVNAAAALNRSPEFRQHASLLRGCVLLDKGDVAAALREFSSARPVGTLRFPLLQYTAQALYRTGRIFEAAQLLATLVEEDPNNAEAHRWLGAIHYDVGSQSEAVAELTEAARLNPLDHRPHRLLGLLCTDESLFGLAIEHYRKALELGKDVPQPDIEADLATLLIQRNRFAEALEALATADPTATIWALRADCYDGLGQPQDSREAVRKALLADPENYKALLLYGTQQLADGQAETAIEPLTKVLQRDPHDTRARYQLAMAYQRLGQQDAWQREINARDASTKLHEQFYAAAKQAAAQPGDIQIREQLAEIATALGKKEVARRWELAAVALRKAAENAETDAAQKR